MFFMEEMAMNGRQKFHDFMGRGWRRMISISKKQAVAVFALLLCFAVGGTRPAAAQTANAAQFWRVPTQQVVIQQATKVAIQRITEALDLIKSGKSSEAHARLEQIKGPLRLLLTQTEQFRERANNGHQRCVQSQDALEKRINDLYAQRQGEAEKIGKLRADLAEASKHKEHSSAEIARLQTEIDNAAAQLRRTRDKLKELETWWWVPVYGPYLGIRTLVDNDIHIHNRAIADLQIYRGHMHRTQETMNSLHALIADREASIKSTDKVIEGLQTMEQSDQAKLKELKETAVFLTEADVFWGKANNSLGLHGSDFLETVKRLGEKLAEKRGKGLNNDFRDALIAFAASINNTDFLLKPSTDYCGGPPLLQ